MGNPLHANDDILFYNEDFHKVTFIANQKHILVVNLDKINPHNDNNFLKMILILLFLSDFWVDVVNWKNENPLKKYLIKS